MTGTTLDTGALIALEAGYRRMAVLVEEAVTNRTPLAIPAGVLAQAWRGGSRQARLARLLRSSVCTVVPLDQLAAVRAGALGAATGWADVVVGGWGICARDCGHAVVTTDAADLRAIDPSIPLLTP